ncbi:MAG: glycoside hydrolase family 97 C-terminal domain-containing protein [Bacteroidales bacterium]|nr:glycoside hydrolase family 97 C-terminal domain-containing protein [Bacteroidales bacterium]
MNASGLKTSILLSFVAALALWSCGGKSTPQAITDGLSDAPDADYRTNSQAYIITKRTVSAESVLKLRMAPAGGFAVSLRSL